MDITTRDSTTAKLIVIAIFAIILCFSPLMTNSDIIAEYQADFRDSLSDKAFQFSTVASFSLAIPILLDIALDTLLQSGEFFAGVKLCLWFVILMLISASALTLLVIIPMSLGAVFACIVPAVDIVVLCTSICICNTYGRVVWKFNYIWPILVVYSIGSISCSYISFTKDAEARHQLEIATYIFWVLSGFFMVCLSLQWFRQFVNVIQSDEHLSEDDKCCALNLIVGSIYWIIHITLILSLRDGNALHSGVTYQIARNYWLSAFVLVVAAITTRYNRAAVVLASAQREAETKRMLVGFFSHEIRTPLNSVMMGLQVVEKEIKNGRSATELFEIIDELHTQCDLAVDILNDLLLYERLEEGIIDLNLKPLPVKSFIKKKVKALLPQCTSKQITLDIKFPDVMIFNGIHSFNRAYCRADEDKLGQVLRTLLANAIECTPPKGKITLKVNVISKDTHEDARKSSLSNNLTRRDIILSSAKSIPRKMSSSKLKSFRAKSSKVMQKADTDLNEKWILQIQVTDSGAGMKLEDQQAVFDNALSFTAGVLQVRQGKGLGLWISHSIVSHHDGRLYVSSEGLGKGSTFTMEMPSYFASTSGRIQWRLGSTSEFITKHIRFSFSNNRRSSVSNTNGQRRSLNAFVDVIEMMSNGVMRTMHSVNTRGSLNGGHHLLEVSDRSGARSPLPQRRSSGPKLSRQNSSHRLKPRLSLALSNYRDGRVDSVYVTDGKIRECCDETAEPETGEGVVSQTRLLTAKSPLRSRVVLVVDDAPMNRRMLCRLLVGYCDSSVQAEDGAVAVDKMRASMAEGKPFVLVLMDYQMPNMDGPTAAKEMRALGYTGPIIGVTGNTLPHHIRTFIEGGANYVVNKPLDFETLRNTLQDINMGHVLAELGDDLGYLVDESDEKQNEFDVMTSHT